MKCSYCGSETSKLKYANRRSRKIYCSKDCMYANTIPQLVFARILGLVIAGILTYRSSVVIQLYLYTSKTMLF